MNIPWVGVKWVRLGDEHLIDPISIDFVSWKEGNRFAIRRLGFCLNDSLEWELEPMPSSRNDDFFKRCRVNTFEEAEKRVQDWMEEEKKEG
jgi:hypothetical protein